LGFGHLLPRGFLRERPVGLRRAAAIGLARCDLIEPQQLDSLERDLRRWNDHAIWFRTSLAARSLLTSEGQTQPLQHLANSPVFAFAGIGNPDAFRQTLDRCGGRVVGFHSWPDHHEYTAPDIQRIRLAARRAGAAAIVCTHKDLVKLDQLDRTTSDERLPLYALIVEVVWHAGQADMEKLILDVVGAKRPR
jgi:tetraacyldisaccharide 4'-kinase